MERRRRLGEAVSSRCRSARPDRTRPRQRPLAGGSSRNRSGRGLPVSGEKWLINNATRGSLLSCSPAPYPAAARGLHPAAGGQGTLPAGTYRLLDKVHTHGIRGADICGIAFDRAPVPRRRGGRRSGGRPETVLKALQLTRTLCASLSLGAADHALALGFDFAAERGVCTAGR